MSTAPVPVICKPVSSSLVGDTWCEALRSVKSCILLRRGNGKLDGGKEKRKKIGVVPRVSAVTSCYSVRTREIREEKRVDMWVCGYVDMDWREG